ncbi:MAG: hypothetical protein JNL54_03365 [Kineosporiaceae bacterium]|nr:hypothetical protein [Kineosporiaceae bacterium]
MTATAYRTHQDSVTEIAAQLAGRDHFVLAGVLTPGFAYALATLPTWRAWLAGPGSPEIVCLPSAQDSRDALLVLGELLDGQVVIVATVPKTVPASRVAAALGSTQIPADGSRDVICVSDAGDDLVRWPILLVDAIAVNDPQGAASIRLHDIAAMN